MKSILSSPPHYRLADFLFTLMAVALTTAVLVLLRGRLSTQVIALLYLLPVMLSATRWGLLPALVASLAAFIAFNYFFLIPTYTLTVSDPEELLALLVFLIVAVLVSQSVGAANLHAAQARAREMEATTLYNLTRALSAQTGPDETLASVTRLVTEAFELASCEILLAGVDESLQSPAHYEAPHSIRSNGFDHLPTAQTGTIENSQAPSQIEHSQPQGQVVEILLTAHQVTVGTLRLMTRSPDMKVEPTTMRLLTTFAAQIGLFIERTRLAREADRARLLEESDQLKSALLSSVSHDLRTPLSAIKASATVLLQEDVALDAAARYDLLSAINEETDRLNRLVGDLLDMSRIEAGALRLKLDWCDLDELIRAVVHRLSPHMTAFQVQFDWPANLPFVYADYVQIDRVMTNLLENAVRFAPPGSAIKVSAEARAATVTIAVTNQGPAIPERLHPHLFGKFYRVSEDRAPGMGTGLGLSICKGIIEAHGGRIWVESPVAHHAGARFVFTLPLPAEAPPRVTPDDEMM
jgi:two-component system sensor histidine kinase KdpD